MTTARSGDENPDSPLERERRMAAASKEKEQKKRENMIDKQIELIATVKRSLEETAAAAASDSDSLRELNKSKHACLIILQMLKMTFCLSRGVVPLILSRPLARPKCPCFGNEKLTKLMNLRNILVVPLHITYPLIFETKLSSANQTRLSR
jgi:hypothetical protein